MLPEAFPSGEGAEQREADEGRGAKTIRLHSVECSMPSYVCSASLRSHLPPGEGIFHCGGVWADRVVRPYKDSMKIHGIATPVTSVTGSQ